METAAARDVLEIKALLKELLGEMAALKERVIRLEQEAGLADKPASVQKSFVLAAESYDNIGALYREGYHICPVAYGQVRDEEECLFCVNLLEKK